MDVILQSEPFNVSCFSFAPVLQLGIKMHKLGERCDLFQEGGQVTDPAIDKRMDFHFNAILDVVSEWRKDKSQNQDTPLGGAELLSPNTTWML